MKSTGIVRRLDQLGRIVLPIELRRTLDVAARDGLEIYVDDYSRIHLQKYTPGCVFCGETNDLQTFRGGLVCGDCREELSAFAPADKVESRS